MGRFGAGQSVRRLEDQRLVTGTGSYTDDITRPGQAQAHVLRSPHAHARIRSIDTRAALAAPGVLAVLTASDLNAAGIGPIPVGYMPRNVDGSLSRPPRRPVLADSRVLHVGEAVAFVIAETHVQARDAAELIAVDYDPLDAVAFQRDAVAAGAPQLWDHLPGNIAFDFAMGDKAATDTVFTEATHVVGLDLINNRVVPTPLETRGAIGEVDERGRLVLTTGSQGSHSLRDSLCEVFGAEPADFRVICPDVGGGFGMRLFLFPEHVLVLHAARLLGRPVKWIADRSEAFLADTHGRDHVTRAELALDADGRILALRVDTLANLGGYVSQYGAFVPSQAGVGMMPGVYTMRAMCVRVRGVLTNTAPVDAYRGAGRPEALYLIERMVDAAARKLHLAPDEIRRRNFIPPDAMPYRTIGGHTYDSGEFAAAMDEAMRRADWAGFVQRRTESERRGRFRGIGMSYYVEACGGGSDEGAEIRLEADGTAKVLIGTQSTGQGHETAYAQMAADALGLPPEKVRVIQGDTDQVKDGRGTGGSRARPVGGAATAKAADALAERLKALAAPVLGAQEDELELADEAVQVTGTNRFISLAELARQAGGTIVEAARFKPPATTYPNGCHICEVEVDPETGQVEVVGYTIVDDVGIVLNPLLLAGQVHGGTVQGIGQALQELAAYDSNGQLLSGSLMDYALPHARDVPPIDFTTRPVPCRTNPLGVKGAGEAGSIGAPPAVINAVVDALAPLGVRHIDMPAPPLRVWRTIQEARAP